MELEASRSAMNEIVSLAKDILIRNGYTCVLCSENEEYHSTLRGVKPLLDFLKSGKDFSAFFAADKTVGLGAAHLYVLLGVSSVWASVMSLDALELLEKHNIEVSYEKLVPFIINREGSGRCPIEMAVVGIDSSDAALSAIENALQTLKKG